MALVRLNILLTDNVTTVVVPFPTNTVDGTIPGLDPVDNAIAAIMKRGYFYNSARTIAYSASQIKSITWQ